MLTIERLDARKTGLPTLILPKDLSKICHEECLFCVCLLVISQAPSPRDAVSDVLCRKATMDCRQVREYRFTVISFLVFLLVLVIRRRWRE